MERRAVVSQASGAPTRDGGTARLREAIDSGDTKDKVRWSDPAAAPLGTDEEAAGAAPPRSAVESAQRQETSREGKGHTQNRFAGFLAWFTIVLLVIVGIFLGLWFVR